VMICFEFILFSTKKHLQMPLKVNSVKQRLICKRQNYYFVNYRMNYEKDMGSCLTNDLDLILKTAEDFYKPEFLQINRGLPNHLIDCK
jgi:hypothetical protein